MTDTFSPSALPTSWGDILPARPSSLPKLHSCPCYVGKPGTSAAAERGTRVDAWIRAALAGDESYKGKAPADELRAVEWAVAKVRDLAMSEEVYTREEDCRAESALPKIYVNGTMDTVCPALSWLVDYKTGQIRDYKAQMAAYALACMEMYFADDWTAHLLFADQREVVTYRFTAAEARAYLEEVTSGAVAPSPCDYCTWCARYTSCPALNAMAQQALATAAELPAPTPAAVSTAKRGDLVPSVLAPILADTEKAAAFCDAVDVVTGWAEIVKQSVKDKIAASGGRTLGRWTLSTCKGRESVPPDVVGHYIKELGFDSVLHAFGPMPAAKFRELWADKYAGRADKPCPEEQFTLGAGYSQLRRSKTNKNNDKQ